jgi:hypothetical protein
VQEKITFCGPFSVPDFLLLYQKALYWQSGLPFQRISCKWDGNYRNNGRNGQFPVHFVLIIDWIDSMDSIDHFAHHRLVPGSISGLGRKSSSFPAGLSGATAVQPERTQCTLRKL